MRELIYTVTAEYDGQSLQSFLRRGNGYSTRMLARIKQIDRGMTADAVGPLVLENLLVTRHMETFPFSTAVAALAPETRAHARGKLVQGEGLYHVIVAARGKAAELVRLLYTGGEKDYGAGDVPAYPAADLKAVEVRHVHVQQDEVRRAPRLTHGLFPA